MEEINAQRAKALAPYQGRPAPREAKVLVADRPAVAPAPGLAESVPERGGVLIPPTYSTKRGRRR